MKAMESDFHVKRERLFCEITWKDFHARLRISFESRIISTV